MPSCRAAGHEFTVTAPPSLFWRRIGLNRLGIGIVFAMNVPLFHMHFWPAGQRLRGAVL